MKGRLSGKTAVVTAGAQGIGRAAVNRFLAEGATVHAVQLMAATVGGRLGVKASGGIRTTADALAMVRAGATRLGLSGTAGVLAGLDDGAPTATAPTATAPTDGAGGY